MAGVAFKLQKLLSGESLSDVVRAYLYSAMISSGPLLVVMLTLGVVKFIIRSRLTIEQGDTFLALIVYAYAFSMVGVGPFVYVVTRYLADKYFLKEIESFTPIYVSVLEVVLSIQAVVGMVFLWFLPLDLSTKWLLLSMFLFISGIWIAMIFLSASRSYLWIVMSFNVGGIVGILSSIFLGLHYGFHGFVSGYTLGQGIIFFMLTARIYAEFGYERGHDFGFFAYFKKHSYLVGVGLFYYLGIWVDKFVFWFSEKGYALYPVLRIYPDYDTPIFLAFLTIVPSMAFFLVHMETSFVYYYEAYYDSIRSRASLESINEKLEAIRENLGESLQKYVLFQGTFSGLVILTIYAVSEAFQLSPFQMGIFRIGILGAFLQMGYIMVLNILFYFDFQKSAFWTTFLFFAANWIATWITTKLSLPAYGFGYTFACFITVVVSFMILDKKLKNLNYWTFMRQPVFIPKYKLESENH